MAKNECWSKGGGCEITLNEGDAAYYGAALDSGEPAEWSEFTGVALIDFAANADGVMTRCIGFTLTVTPQDDGGAQAVAVGDPLYFHDTTGVIDKAVNGGQFIGWATVAVPSQATAICVLLDQDPDYTRFMDEQLLEFGDGVAGKGGAGDVRIWFELDDQDFYIQNELEGSRTYIDSGVSTGRLDLQNHDYGALAGEQTAVRISPQMATVSATNAIQALAVVPGIDDGVTGAYVVGLICDVYFRGNSGDWSNVVRAGQFQVTDANLAGRTIAGPVIMIRTWQQLATTVTNGVYAIWSDIAGGGTPYAYWLHVGDDGGQQADLASAVGNINAVIHVEVGATEGYIAVYDGYTP